MRTMSTLRPGGYCDRTSAPVSVSQGNHVVNIEVARDGDGCAGVGCEPLARIQSAAPIRTIGDVGRPFGGEHFVPRVLAIPVFVDPVSPVFAAVNGQIAGRFGHRQSQDYCGDWISLGDVETVGTVLSAGVAVAADVTIVAVGVGDRVLEAGVSVGTANVAVDPDAGRAGVELTVGEPMGWDVLAGSAGARMSTGGDPAVGNSGEHANRTRAMPARKTKMVFFTADDYSSVAGTAGLKSVAVQGRTPMRNFLVSHSTQTERVAARPFFMVTASMSFEEVLALHLTQ